MTSLADLVATSLSPRDALWTGSPDVCPATRVLIDDAMGCWAPSRHLLFHLGVRHHVFVVALCICRVQDRHNVPTELWQKICSYFRRADWAAPIA